MRPRWATWPGPCGSCGFRFFKSSREWQPDESAAVGVVAEVIEFDSLYDMEQLSLNQRVRGSSPRAPPNLFKGLAGQRLGPNFFQVPNRYQAVRLITSPQHMEHLRDVDESIYSERERMK